MAGLITSIVGGAGGGFIGQLTLRCCQGVANSPRSFGPVIVGTRTDEDFSGVLRRDAADEIVLGTGPDTEMRIARSDITEMRPGAVSVMPTGLNQQLSRQELADLIAFLKNTKWGVN